MQISRRNHATFCTFQMSLCVESTYKVSIVALQIRTHTTYCLCALPTKVSFFLPNFDFWSWVTFCNVFSQKMSKNAQLSEPCWPPSCRARDGRHVVGGHSRSSIMTPCDRPLCHFLRVLRYITLCNYNLSRSSLKAGLWMSAMLFYDENHRNDKTPTPYAIITCSAAHCVKASEDTPILVSRFQRCA